MDCAEIISAVKEKFPAFKPVSVEGDYPDEVRIKAERASFRDTCVALHKALSSPVMMLFAFDQRVQSDSFVVNCVFADLKNSRWVIVSTDVPADEPRFETLSRDIYSAALFEREIREMFGIEPSGNPDLRRFNLHEEVLPEGNYPLRKDFKGIIPGSRAEYKFNKVEGEGIFEVPVGPVHAGIIGPGHFRFSAAGEPIVNLEIRLGFTHRGVEKLFEGKSYAEAIRLAECVCGDTSFAHSLAFAGAAEKISGLSVPSRAAYLRAIFLELERIYNHVNDIGGIALDVGFSFPAAYASLIKESLLQLNEKLSGSRYLKGINTVGGVLADIDAGHREALLGSLKKIKRDFDELAGILNSSVSFMDRVDSAGALKRKTAEDLGVIGLAGRASGVPVDLRKYFPGVYKEAGFRMALQERGDVLARLRVRIFEFEESCRLIKEFCGKLDNVGGLMVKPEARPASGLGYAEAWRGPVLYWLKTDASGLIERCKIVDSSFHNWQGLSYAVLGDIIPDFPLCNKSFDLSYPGNDL